MCVCVRLATAGLGRGMRVSVIVINSLCLLLAVLGVPCCSLFSGCGTWASPALASLVRGPGSVLVATGLVAPRTWGPPGSGVESMPAALAGVATREAPGCVLSPLHFQCQMHTKCSIKVCEKNKRVNE